jgi:hypothetical protein
VDRWAEQGREGRVGDHDRRWITTIEKLLFMCLFSCMMMSIIEGFLLWASRSNEYNILDYLHPLFLPNCTGKVRLSVKAALQYFEEKR